MTTLFALFAEVERDLISERTREGLAKARASGRKLGRPKGSLGVSRLDGKEDEIRHFLELGVSKTAIAKIFEATDAARRRPDLLPWRHVIVDEYQDVNPAQAAFVHALTTPKCPGPGGEGATLIRRGKALLVLAGRCVAGGPGIRSPGGLPPPRRKGSSVPVPIDLVRKRSATPLRGFAGEPVWCFRAVELPPDRRGSGCANGEAPAGDGSSPRVPGLAVFRNADGNAVILR